MIELKIYVPKAETWAAKSIWPGSGVVGRPVTLDKGDIPRIKIDYQNVLGRNSNIQTWEDAVFHAAGRQLHTSPGGPPSLGSKGYPTGSRIWAPADDLIEVGVFRCDASWKYTIEITNPEALEAWKS